MLSVPSACSVVRIVRQPSLSLTADAFAGYTLQSRGCGHLGLGLSWMFAISFLTFCRAANPINF